LSPHTDDLLDHVREVFELGAARTPNLGDESET